MNLKVIPMLEPSRLLEKLLIDCKDALPESHWLCFGGLYGLISNRGVVPDGDLDFCVPYGLDWENIGKRMAGKGFRVKKILLNDITGKALYMAFEREVHVCLSFWYKWENLSFYCHDNKREIPEGQMGIPSTYFFKGVPTELIEDFTDVQWVGIPQTTTVRVPVLAGSLLDLCYPAWAYKKQRHVINDYQVEEDKDVSLNDALYNKKTVTNAYSPYRVEVKSMSEFKDADLIHKQLENSRNEWRDYMKSRFLK